MSPKHAAPEPEPTLEERHRAWKASMEVVVAEGERLARAVDQKLRSMEGVSAGGVVDPERERHRDAARIANRFRDLAAKHAAVSEAADVDAPAEWSADLRTAAARACTKVADELVAWHAAGGGAPTPQESLEFRLRMIDEDGIPVEVGISGFAKVGGVCVPRWARRIFGEVGEPTPPLRGREVLSHGELIEEIGLARAVEVPR